MATVDHPVPPSTGTVPPSTGTVPPSTGAASPSADASENAVAPPSAGAGPSGSTATADFVMPDLEGRNAEGEDIRFGEQDEDANWNYDHGQYPGRQPWWRRGQSWGWQDGGGWKTSTDAKGYLPKVPGYDGDRQKEPKGFQVYKRKVEGFVQIRSARGCTTR